MYIVYKRQGGGGDANILSQKIKPKMAQGGVGVNKKVFCRKLFRVTHLHTFTNGVFKTISEQGGEVVDQKSL